VEREIMLTGIGGQGVQLGAQVLARAAVLEGRQVMMLGTYGGTMRGGPTESTLVVADRPISTPPIVAQTWSALAMHHAFFEPLRAKLRPDAVVLVNSSLFEGEAASGSRRVFEIPATQMASDLGSALTASMVGVAAFAALTGLVELDSLVSAMCASVPAYRTQHLETNERALRTGYAAAPPNAAPAWAAEAGAAFGGAAA